MTTLQLSSVRVEWGGRQVGPVSGVYDGQLTLLFGDFDWLFAVLLGEATPLEGEVRCLDTEGRQATIAGRVGVSPAPVHPAPSWTVFEWLRLNCELLGQGRALAKRSADAVLAELGLQTLGERRVSDLNGAESFAAHAAFAMSSSPELAVLGAPLLLPETRDYEFGLIKRLLERTQVALVARRRDPELWELANVHAYCDPNGRSRLPSELVAKPGPCYLVRTFDQEPRWLEALHGRGIRVTPSAPGSWVVELPQGSGPELIAETAVAAGIALAELVSIEEAR
jgi:hypothetical protein